MTAQSATPGEDGSRRALKHVQVREYVRDLLRDASSGTAAPSERDLVARFGVARMTVRQAIDALVAEGVLERIPGRGTFVGRRDVSPSRVTGLTEEAVRNGSTVESRTLFLGRARATESLARALEVTADDPVLRWERLRLVDGQVVSFSVVYLNEALFPGFLLDRPPHSLYDELQSRGLHPTWAEDVLRSAVAGDREAELLQLEPGSPVLRQQRRSVNRDRTVEVSESSHRVDRIRARFLTGGS